MKASYLGAMGYSHRINFPAVWPIPPGLGDPETSVKSYQEGIEECEFAEAPKYDAFSVVPRFFILAGGAVPDAVAIGSMDERREPLRPE